MSEISEASKELIGAWRLRHWLDLNVDEIVKHIESLEAQLTEARRERDKFYGELNLERQHSVELEAQLQECRNDAARYKWLRENYHGFAQYRSGVVPYVNLDTEVDKAMSQEKADD